MVVELKAANKRLIEEIRHITAENESLKLEVAELSLRNTTLQTRIFTVDEFVEADKDLIFYTGFPNRAVFEIVSEFLDPGSEGENINYW